MTHEDDEGEKSRFERGQEILSEIHGELGNNILSSLSDVAPDFARHIFEFPYADIYSRPGLDRRARAMVTIAALAAMGNAAPQLKVHIEASLNVGVTREEIIEIMMQTAVYAGFPAAMNGIVIAKEVFARRDAAA